MRGWKIVRRLTGNLVLLAVSATLALMVVEVAGRFVGAWRPDRGFRFHPVRGYELTPGIGETNSLGFHGPEISLADPRGVTRIVVLGDSYAYGAGVPAGEALPAQLERQLNGVGAARYQVLNMGVPGYNTDQELSYLREKGLALQPRMIVVGFNMSDAELGFLGLKDTSNLPVIRLKEFIKAHFGLYLWTKDMVFQFLERRGHDDPEVGVWPSMVPLRDAAVGKKNEGWDRCQEALDGFGQECRQTGAPCFLVLWPMFEKLDDYPYLRENELVRTRADAAGFSVLNLFELFKGEDERSLRLSERDSHPNAVAYERAARALVDLMRSKGALATLPATGTAALP